MAKMYGGFKDISEQFLKCLSIALLEPQKNKTTLTSVLPRATLFYNDTAE